MKKTMNMIFATVFFAVALSACKEDDPSANIRLANIPEAVVATSDFDVLEAAVKKANLVTDLGATGPLTLFAPTDAAFQTFFAVSTEDSAVAAIEKTDPAVLTNILKYHVVAKKAKSSELTAGSVTTLNGKTFTVDLSNGVKLTGSGNAGKAANVTSADVEVSNGLIHVIDRVLLPN
jgi:uncharacterized surface protein with fasciclin (FAS1) repeats